MAASPLNSTEHSHFVLDETEIADALKKYAQVQRDFPGHGYVIVNKVGNICYTGSVMRPGYTTVVVKGKTLRALLATLQGTLDSIDVVV